ncbi:MAG: hypothetical protein WA667_19665 [Candidatus Nitrosopolaris sp.]
MPVISHLINLIEKQFCNYGSKTLEEQSLKDIDLIFYGEKLIIELRFESKSHPSREYERQRFKHRADREKVVLEGKCEMCSKKNVVIWPYIEYKRRVADLEEDDLIRFDCQRCKKRIVALFLTFDI